MKKIISVNLDKTTRLREERIITNVFVNFLVPLSFLALAGMFDPRISVLIPIQEREECHMYFLFRSPIPNERIPPTLLWFQNYWHKFVNSVELILMLMITIIIYMRKKTQIQEISLNVESLVMSLSWLIFNVISTIVHNQETINEMTQEKVNMAFIILRNLACAIIPYFFSVFLVNRKIAQA